MENLEVLVKRDGTWLHFIATNGKQATLRVESLAESRHGIIGMALSAWANDRQREVAHGCERCGERIENGTEPDGCRDPDCPEITTP